MRTSSLSLRVALIAAGGTAIALLVAGAVFILHFGGALERRFDAQLQTLLSTLIAATDLSGEVDKAAVEGETGGTSSRPLSGWYWQILDVESGTVIDESGSLRFDLLRVPELPTQTDRSISYTTPASGGRELRVLAEIVTLAPGHTFTFLVAGDTQEMAEEVVGFRNNVIAWLGALAGLLAVGITLLMQWGLRPLRGVRRDLGQVREGEIQHLTGAYPSEIEPLVQDLNALIDSNREIVERARTHVGNLAHALKTPLAVLQNEATGSGEGLALKVGEQTRIMRGHVEHHLNRARMAAQSNVLGAVTPIAPVLDSLARVMRKVHQERALLIEAQVSPALRFRGEKHDFEEMAGNLFDNACKWATSRVSVSAARTEIGPRPFVLIAFEDDGPGLAEEHREAVLARGRRLDESKPGSGLGLSIVVELARIYGGRLDLERSEFGGLAARLTLPAAGD